MAKTNLKLVTPGLRGEDSIAELCRREGIAQNCPSSEILRQEAS